MVEQWSTKLFKEAMYDWKRELFTEYDCTKSCMILLYIILTLLSFQRN